MGKIIENNRKIISSEAGAALIVALGVVMVMMIIGALVVSIALNRDKTVSHDRQLTEAESVAEAGIDEAIQVTLSNFNSVYSGGVIPPANTSGDGILLINNKSLTNSNNVRVGSYSVWTKADPNVAGNVLITAKGTDDAQSPFTSTVRVSVKYASNFDYALFTGTPSNLSNTTFTAQGRGDQDDDNNDCGESDNHDSDGSCGANITVTGKVNVNGNMAVNALSSGDNGNHWNDDHGNQHYDDHNESPGFVTFTPRQGFTDPVNWTNSLTGNKPAGTQPVRGNTIAFPSINFDAFTGSSMITVNFPSSGAPTGWTRSWNSNTFSITADNFQSRYGSYDVVKFTSSQSNVKMQINGTCTSPSLTSTIMVAGVSGSNTGISELDMIGPGIDLQPNNGIAILSGEGLVSLQNEVEVGKVGDGALIYLSGQNGTSSLQVNGNLIMYGSIIVNGATTFTAQGVGRTDHHDHGDEDHHYGSHYCDSKYDEHHSDEGNGNTTNQFLSYDGAFLTNSRLPANWWTWNGGTNFTAVKYNFVRS